MFVLLKAKGYTLKYKKLFIRHKWSYPLVKTEISMLLSHISSFENTLYVIYLTLVSQPCLCHFAHAKAMGYSCHRSRAKPLEVLHSLVLAFRKSCQQPSCRIAIIVDNFSFTINYRLAFHVILKKLYCDA